MPTEVGRSTDSTLPIANPARIPQAACARAVRVRLWMRLGMIFRCDIAVCAMETNNCILTLTRRAGQELRAVRRVITCRFATAAPGARLGCGNCGESCKSVKMAHGTAHFRLDLRLDAAGVRPSVLVASTLRAGHAGGWRGSSGCGAFGNLARPTGVEPVTFGFGNQHSIQLSYGRGMCILPRRSNERPVAIGVLAGRVIM